ncbi:translation factor Sua5 [Kiloniella spongiae]|uniref:Threonylcarbamoyl-AMP synthase n=1 Tax=Kiloniella spongiae TaxID=1489064 RepID=A0A0H2MC24_9PROT|nr:L-threonylcarbamoyladenylate synthase [Kiloniella spongiae]KLN60079.1 translation factor Sua5 [Kiloniella spongiae]
MASVSQNRYQNIFNADQAGLDHACNLLRAGGLVAFPTETVYGLGANATDATACASIYEAKGRPSFNPLIVHFPDLAEAEKRVTFNEKAQKLAQIFWPGPLTLVLPRAESCDIAELCSAGLPSLAVRVPGHPIAHALLQQSSLPLAAPSANASGKISPTRSEHVAYSLGEKVSCILDGKDTACAVGLESTVIDLTGEIPVLLRPGNITREEIEAVIGSIQMGKSLMESKAEASPDDPTTENTFQSQNALKSPGLLKSHYAPTLPLRLNATEVAANEALLAFGKKPLLGAAYCLNLSEKGDLLEAAANLFSALHELDQKEDVQGIAAMPIPNTGLGLAINDRLKRAAAPK